MNQITAAVLKMLPRQPVIKFVFGENVKKEEEKHLISWASSVAELTEKMSKLDYVNLRTAIKTIYEKTFSNFEVFFRDHEVFVVTGTSSRKYYIEFDGRLEPDLIED